MTKKKLLLTAVFAPYGVKDYYAEEIGMQMELRNNNITREQGIHSPREDALSYCLYLLAENISVPCVVLDFPSWKNFTEELKKGYSHVGITFIIPNVFKVKRMCDYIAKEYPQIRIILGGFGTMIPELKDMIPNVEICRGEGVRWLREYFGDDPNAPIKHPIMDAHTYEYIYGYKTKPNYSVIVTGVGCNKGCDFCCTSHNYGTKYIPFLKTGEEIISVCRQMEEQKGYRGFSIMDENFLLHPVAARQMLVEMEKLDKHYSFFIFASADVIVKLGIDFLSRLGVRVVWVGVESKEDNYHKLKGIDVRALIRDIQSQGISVIASGILFKDHHDKIAIYEEIDWIIGLGADMVQFMNLTPVSSTPLYKKFESEGRINKEICPYRFLSGENYSFFDHPYFKDPEDFRKINRYAFRKNYETVGPSFVNMAFTAIQGYQAAWKSYHDREREGLNWNPDSLRYEKCDIPRTDEFMKKRLEIMAKVAKSFRIFLLSAMVYAPNHKSREKVRRARKLYNGVFGKPTVKEILRSYYILFCATIEIVRAFFCRLIGKRELVRQPRVIRTEYPRE